MYADEEFRITTCADLRRGDVVEARIKGQLYLRGEVTELMSAHDLFWIREDSLGNRRLLNLNEIEIFIIQAPRLIQIRAHEGTALVRAPARGRTG